MSASRSPALDSLVVDRDASQSAPHAAVTFSLTPNHVVPRNPIEGMSQKPVASAPTAAPAVFAASQLPGVRRAAGEPADRDRKRRAHCGRRHGEERHGEHHAHGAECRRGQPIVYAHARSGTNAASIAGSTIAMMPIAASHAA